VVVGAGAFLLLLLPGPILGGTECNRGEGNWFGELIDDSWPVYPALALLAALALGWAVARAPRP
jgi:hypothetical protein